MRSFCLAILAMLPCLASAALWPQFYDSDKGAFVDGTAVFRAIREHDVIFAGEMHDHQQGHLFELFLLTSADIVTDGNAALALEMFERDTQAVLDGYLSGKASRDYFEAQARPWPNYRSDYAPLIEHAKRRKLDVLAMNVPRRYAAFASAGKESALFSMPELERNFMAPAIIATPGRYRDKFYETMSGHVPPEKIELYYRGQSLKDDTMAMSIVQHQRRKPGTKIISVTGAFHSDEGLGVVAKVKAQLPALRTYVISIVPVNTNQIPDPAPYRHLGQLLVFAPGNPSDQRDLAAQVISGLVPDGEFSVVQK